MQKQGTVIRWDATRAFGFIRSPGTSADVFFHVRDYRGTTPPREGLAVVYEEIHVGGKGPRAMAVLPAAQPGAASPSRPSATSPPRRARHKPAQRATQPQAQRHRRPAESNGLPTPAGPALVLMLGWVALLAWGLWASRLPWWVLGAAVAVNLLTFLVYAIDKSAAQNGHWRTKESHLHLLGLAAAGRARGLPSNGCGTNPARWSFARSTGPPWCCTAQRSGPGWADGCHSSATHEISI